MERGSVLFGLSNVERKRLDEGPDCKYIIISSRDFLFNFDFSL